MDPEYFRGYEQGTCKVHGVTDGAVYCCWDCGGEGEHDMYDSDPLWYCGDNSYEECETCDGEGHYWVCAKCAKESKDER